MNTTPETIDSKLVVQGIHFELTEALREAIREKFALLLRHNDFIVRINVRLAQEQVLGKKPLFRATAQIEIGGPDLVASADGKDAYGVIEAVVDKLDRLLERRHGLRKGRRNHPHDIELDAPIPKVE